ncbi:hypothetical protein N864_16725 [Intrasporangium chromatireducens Q5-1]|uniref:Uncharacterized protein n=1 Tax=Intrasporangium chromatireducens Q5-1 TaxID=584657 RepID=W9GPM6_9MICO|nr:hypothetical protein [Intrasporangium chromatireducens]EWT06788.1 hypothetical protein N864_16725 [Intrasporangium chromatireducens Q5-1]
MALIVLTSAAGSPGTTTTAVGLALSWPRPVLLVEADPTGGSPVLAGYFRGTITPSHGLIDLALAHREGRLEEALPGTLLPIPGHDASLLPGVRGHVQARSLAAAWEPLAQAFRGLHHTGQDVIVDAGRLGLTGSPDALIKAADLALLAIRTDLVSLAAARSWAEAQAEEFRAMGTCGSLGLLLVGEKRPYAAADVAKVMGLPIVASIAWDPAAAQVFSHGATPPRRFEHGVLVRSLHAARSAIQARLTAGCASVTPSPLAMEVPS